jgi:hypothetical protein
MPASSLPLDRRLLATLSYPLVTVSSRNESNDVNRPDILLIFLLELYYG